MSHVHARTIISLELHRLSKRKCHTCMQVLVYKACKKPI